MNFHIRKTPFLAVLLLLALPAPARPQDGGQEPAQRSASGPYVRHPEAVKAIGQLKSPYCPGFMLEVCSSPGASMLRDSVVVLAEQGWPADSIVSHVIAMYEDPKLLALPPRRGKALVAWVVPPAAVLAGLGIVILALQRMMRSRPRQTLHDELRPEEEEKLREALRELEAEEEVPFI